MKKISLDNRDVLCRWLLGTALAMMSGGAVQANDYYVATNGSNTATGTKTQPFLTIQQAAEVMQAGDTCYVRPGTYREWVQPPRGGTAESQRIRYVAEPGGEVLLKGSERINTWSHQPDGTWRVELPDSFFKDYNPYKINLKGGWLHYGTNLHVGMVYIDGVPCRELTQRAEVVTQPRTFAIEASTNTTTLVANFAGADPNVQLAEINVRECIFFPRVKGLQFITVDGFSLRHAAANWAAFRAFQHAALGTYWGRDWLIQNCRISDARCVAIVCGNDPSHEDKGFDAESVGHHVVRHNLIQRCGEAGIHGFKGWAGSVIENNLIEDINVWNEFGGYETGGIKLHDAVDVTIRNNVIRRVQDGKGDFVGIWIDWGAQGTRVTGNIVYDMTAKALYIQNTHGPVLVDNNIFSGRVRSTAGNVVFAHNLYAACDQTSGNGDGKGVYWQPHSGTVAAVAPFVREQNKFFNNLFVRHGLDRVREAGGYESEWNVFYAGAKKSLWGDAAHSVQDDFDPDVQFTSLPNGVEVVFRASEAARTLKCLPLTRERIGKFARTGQGLDDHAGQPMNVDCDLLGLPRAGAKVAVGPLEKLDAGINRIRLIAGPEHP